MIVVKVELWSAVTGHTTELARMEIANDGDLSRMNITRGDYEARTLKGRSAEQLNRRTTQRQGFVKNWPRLQLHVWNLVATALKEMGYGRQTD